MEIKVIIAAHKQYPMPDKDCYLPVQVGRALHPDVGYIPDNTGDNISEKNPYYCELTGLYWAWKNLKADYIGLVHYRRHLANGIRKLMFWKKNPFYAVLTEKEIRNILKKTDIILPAKRHYYIENLYSHYAHTHYEEHLILTRKIIEKRTPEYLDAYDHVMKQTSGHMFNMFVCHGKSAMNTAAGCSRFWKNWSIRWIISSITRSSSGFLAESVNFC